MNKIEVRSNIALPVQPIAQLIILFFFLFRIKILKTVIQLFICHINTLGFSFLFLCCMFSLYLFDVPQNLAFGDMRSEIGSIQYQIVLQFSIKSQLQCRHCTPCCNFQFNTNFFRGHSSISFFRQCRFSGASVTDILNMGSWSNISTRKKIIINKNYRRKCHQTSILRIKQNCFEQRMEVRVPVCIVFIIQIL